MKRPLVGDWECWVELGHSIALDGSISPGAKALYWILACYRNQEKGLAWPSTRTLRNHTGQSKETIQKLRRELETHGLLEVFKPEPHENPTNDSENMRYLLKPYSKAVHINKKKGQSARRGRGQTTATIREDIRLEKKTPEPDHPRSTKNTWEYHPATCGCLTCENHRKI